MLREVPPETWAHTVSGEKGAEASPGDSSVLSAQNWAGVAFLPTLPSLTMLCPGYDSEFKPVPHHRHSTAGTVHSMNEPRDPASPDFGG